jgi:hypothetical protein
VECVLGQLILRYFAEPTVEGLIWRVSPQKHLFAESSYKKTRKTLYASLTAFRKVFSKGLFNLSAVDARNKNDDIEENNWHQSEVK